MLKMSIKETDCPQIKNNMQAELPHLNVQTLDGLTKKFPFMLEVATPEHLAFWVSCHTGKIPEELWKEEKMLPLDNMLLSSYGLNIGDTINVILSRRDFNPGKIEEMKRLISSLECFLWRILQVQSFIKSDECFTKMYNVNLEVVRLWMDRWTELPFVSIQVQYQNFLISVKGDKNIDRVSVFQNNQHYCVNGAWRVKASIEVAGKLGDDWSEVEMFRSGEWDDVRGVKDTKEICDILKEYAISKI